MESPKTEDFTMLSHNSKRSQRPRYSISQDFTSEEEMAQEGVAIKQLLPRCIFDIISKHHLLATSSHVSTIPSSSRGGKLISISPTKPRHSSKTVCETSLWGINLMRRKRRNFLHCVLPFFSVFVPSSSIALTTTTELCDVKFFVNRCFYVQENQTPSHAASTLDDSITVV